MWIVQLTQEQVTLSSPYKRRAIQIFEWIHQKKKTKTHDKLAKKLLTLLILLLVWEVKFN